MTINKGYEAKHKVDQELEELEEDRIVIKCPNCKHEMELLGNYDEAIMTNVICSECKFLARKYNFAFIKTVE